MRFLLSQKRYLSFVHPTRRLGDIVKLGLFNKLGPTAAKKVWEEQHSLKHDGIGTTLNTQQYDIIRRNSSACPMFIFPVCSPNDLSKYFVLLSQWQDNSCFFTSLDDFKKNPTTAKPLMVLSLFDELTSQKHLEELILVRNDILNTSIQKPIARMITEHVLNRYYDASAFKLVEQFNLRPREFDFISYLKDWQSKIDYQKK